MSDTNLIQKKPQKGLKILSYILIALLALIVIATILIGNFFVNYALVPNQGAENREPIADESIPGVEDIDLSLDQIIQRNKSMSEDLADEWLVETEHLREERTIQTEDDLTIYGNAHIQENNTNQWVVMVHGYQADEEDTHKTAYNYYEAGYNVLTYNHRAIVPSEGNYITMGIKESDDLIIWLNSIISDNQDAEIIVHGTSMGAATSLMASGKSDFPEQVIAVIADCSYSSVWGVFSSELYQRFELPSFPFLHMAGVMALPRVGINLMGAEADVVEHVTKSTTPTLFIHGTADDFVPYPMVYDLHEALDADKEIFIVEGAGHADSQFADPALYFETIFDFIDSLR